MNPQLITDTIYLYLDEKRKSRIFGGILEGYFWTLSHVYSLYTACYKIGLMPI